MSTRHGGRGRVFHERPARGLRLSPPHPPSVYKTLLRVLFRQRGSFRSESAFTNWLHRLTTDFILMHFRRGKARKEATTDDGETPEPAVEVRATASQSRLLDRVALEVALAQLSPGYRTVFVLHDVEGYEHEEIARLLGLSAGTSKSQPHKTRLRLRRLLAETAAPAEQRRAG